MEEDDEPITDLNATSIRQNETNSHSSYDDPATDTSTERKNHVPQILIQGDEYARSFRRLLDSHIDKSFHIDALVKPNIQFSYLTKDLFQKVINFGQDDYVVMVNTNNISNSKSFYKGISNLLPISKFTNLILLCERNKIADQILINRIIPAKQVWAVAGDNADLPCDITPALPGDNVTMLFWYKDGMGMPLYR
nr:unnamed protein product [Callosobruchus analis]